MRLVAGALEQAERRAAARQPQWIAVARQIDLFFSFGETHDRQPLLSLLLRRLDRRGQLSLPAVDHDQIGNLFLLGDAPRQEPPDDLFHGREVVDAFYPLDAIAAVLRLARPAALEPDQRADGVPALIVRNVDADHGAGRSEEHTSELQ